MMNKLFTFLAVLIVAGGVYWYWERNDVRLTEPSILESPLNIDMANGWQKQAIDEIGLSFQMPKDAMFRKEVGKDGAIRKLVFYVQKGGDDNLEYILYGLYQFQPDRIATKEVDLERWKAEMNPDTVKNTTIGEYVGIEGFIEGTEPQYISGRTRYVKVVLKDGGLLSISTLPPTQENKELTERILETFDFQANQ